ncbi:hypothetical protein [Flavobacterium sp. T12S277]|uniref:hypothetical protein n=1 Tax=Flavobacterium sp. T12S277 TaxID=3402752 RepID=UPI003AE0287F
MKFDNQYQIIMKPKRSKLLKKVEEKRMKEGREAVIVRWFVKVIVARTLKELEEKQERGLKDETSNL